MSSTESLAQKILQILESEKSSRDISDFRATLDAINSRLDKLESAVVHIQPSASLNPQINHPSLDKFAIAEAIADNIIAGQSAEKACAFEPNGKPCDHCSMCSSRGF